MTSEARQRELIRTLVERGVDLILVGGHAVAAHGYERGTRGVDLVYDLSAANCARFADALNEIGASVVAADLPTRGESLSGEWLAEGGHFRFATDLGPIDALPRIGGKTFEELRERAVVAELADGTKVPVCSYEDLVAFKEGAGRPQDQVDLRALRELREDDP